MMKVGNRSSSFLLSTTMVVALGSVNLLPTIFLHQVYGLQSPLRCRASSIRTFQNVVPTVPLPATRTTTGAPPSLSRTALTSTAAADSEEQQRELSLLDPSTVVSKVFDENDKRPVILFDGVCNLCNNAVNLALDWDPKGKLRFSALQSNVGRSLLEANGRAPNDISSIVLVTEKGAYVKSDAILKITEELTPKRLLPLRPIAILGRYLVPRIVRDIFYDSVADNRYSLMGKRDTCRFDADGEFENRFVNDELALRN